MRSGQQNHASIVPIDSKNGASMIVFLCMQHIPFFFALPLQRDARTSETLLIAQLPHKPQNQMPRMWTGPN